MSVVKLPIITQDNTIQRTVTVVDEYDELCTAVVTYTKDTPLRDVFDSLESIGLLVMYRRWH